MIRTSASSTALTTPALVVLDTDEGIVGVGETESRPSAVKPDCHLDQLDRPRREDFNDSVDRSEAAQKAFRRAGVTFKEISGTVGLLTGGDGNQVAVDHYSVQTP